MDKGSGRCLCGAVRYAFEGPPLWQNHCHCESCRRATASGFTSFFSLPKARVRWSGEARAYASSPGVTRRFCGTCGTPLSYETAARPDDIDLFAATLDDPAAFRPADHEHWEDHLPWIVPGDGLPRIASPRPVRPDEDFAPVLALIRAAFAYMDGRIDPPSSAHRLTADDLRAASQAGEVWVIEANDRPVGAMVLTFRQDCVYLGKLAVDTGWRRQGVARTLVRAAARRAKDRALPAIELQTRVELAENHRAFQAMGFVRTGESAHPGFDRPTTVHYRLSVTLDRQPGPGGPSES